VRPELPAGTVTFLFTDVEGSTRLLRDLGPTRYAAALAEHRRVLREAYGRHGGVEVDTQGDALFAAFTTAPGAVHAAAEAQSALAGGPVRVRMGLHTGTPLLTDEGYVGVDVHRAARIAAAGHAGQVLLSATTGSLVGGDGLRDLGEHRLKDLGAPERIYQLGDADFPPLKSLYQTNLPVPATPFLGRRHELEEVVALLARDDVRLLTLTGPGGTGKTRMALQATAEAAELFPDGITWVPLAQLRDSELLLPSAVQALGVKDESGRGPGETLAVVLAGKRTLLLLDNAEHLLPSFATELAPLRAIPGPTLLVTSRERLRLQGEHVYAVPSLSDRDGVALFLARARALEPAFAADQAVTELCARLDNLPLALELAAARTTLFSVDQLLERLGERLDLLKGERDADPRQETLRATIEWSYDLLAPDDQTLFRRLSVFAGGCTYEAAERVSGADPDLLQSLLDKSLLRRRGGPAAMPRYGMLETIREYAVERLEESGESSSVRRRHAEYFLALAEEIEPNLVGPGSRSEWLDPLEREHDNLRAGMDWFAASGEADRVLRFAAALWRFWDRRGHLLEGRRRLESALRADERPTAARAKALGGAADMALTSGDVPTGGRCAREALDLHRNLGDAWGAAFSMLMVAYATGQEGDWPGAQQLFGESVGQFRELGDQHYALRAARAHAWAYYEGGDLEQAKELYERIIREARETRDRYPEGIALFGLANIAVDQGRLEDAVPLLEDGQRIFRELGDLLAIADGVGRFARILALADEPATAARVLSSSTALLEQIGAMPPYVANVKEQTLALVRARLDDAAFADAWARGRTLTADEAVALALSRIRD
jgi:predicted ATPase